MGVGKWQDGTIAGSYSSELCICSESEKLAIVVNSRSE